MTRLFTYDNWNPILEWDTAGNEKARNVYGAQPDEILARVDPANGILTYKRDKRGDVTFLFNGATLIEEYTYDAFGRPTIRSADNAERPTSVFENRFMYTGREWIAELGIYDYRNRFYHPELGRFLQVDPIGFEAGDMNLFRYCGDDPVDRSDPFGLEGEIFGPRELEPAVEVARRQIEAATSAPNRKSAIAMFRDPHWPGGKRPVTYYPSKYVPILRFGKGYKVGPTLDAEVIYVNGISMELEIAPAKFRRQVVLQPHSHNDKRGRYTKTPGLAINRWSAYDLNNPDVERMDESTRKWYSRRKGKEVPSDLASRLKSSKTSDAGSGSRSNGITGSDIAGSSGPSAKDIDLAHQATGVPSLGAESVNFAPGRP